MHHGAGRAWRKWHNATCVLLNVKGWHVKRG
jgi:hypothetical protein